MKHFWVKGLSQALPKVHKHKITVRFFVSIWHRRNYGLLITLDCVFLWLPSYTDMCFCMKVHDQNTHKPKHAMKTTSSDSPQWQAVSCSKSENSTRLPHTHMSAALETLQENFIGSFMQLYKAQLVKQTRALWKLSGSEVPRRLRDALRAFKNCTKWHKTDTSEQSSKCIWMTIVCYLSLRDVTDRLIISKPDKNIKQVQKYAHTSQLYLKVAFMQF